MSESNSLPFGRRVNSEDNWVHTSPVTLTGSTDKTLLKRIELPAGYVGLDGEMIIDFLFSNNNSANNKTMSLNLGNLKVGSAELINHVHNTEILEQITLKLVNQHDVASQTALLTETKQNLSPIISVLTDPAIDTDDRMYLDIYGQLESGADNIVLHYVTVLTRYRD